MRIFNYKFPAHAFLMILFGATPFLLYPAGALSETSKMEAIKTGGNTDKIHITARQLVSNTMENNAEFIGNVLVKQGKTQISSDRLTIFFAESSDSGGSSPAQSLEKLVASGNVEIKFDNRLAVARQAVYITAQRLLILKGPEATVTSGENTISGETITFYRDDGRFTVEGGPEGRVKAVILPDESGLE